MYKIFSCFCSTLKIRILCNGVFRFFRALQYAYLSSMLSPEVRTSLKRPLRYMLRLGVVCLEDRSPDASYDSLRGKNFMKVKCSFCVLNTFYKLFYSSSIRTKDGLLFGNWKYQSKYLTSFRLLLWQIEDLLLFFCPL